MSWVDNEISLAQGKPLRLYEFRTGGTVWRYTAGDADITLGDDVYTSLAISDDGIRVTGQTSADALALVAPATLPVAELYRLVPPSAGVGFILKGLHRGDTVATVMWVGTISDVTRTAADRVKITCQSLAAGFDRPGLRMMWQRSCTHSVYNSRCGVDKDVYMQEVIIDAIDNVLLTCNAILLRDNGWYTGGFIEWDIGDEVERRAIELHSANTLRILNTTDGLSAGQTVRVYPGCDHTVTTCNNKFSNIDNFGGFPGIPGRSPFDGNPVF